MNMNKMTTGKTNKMWMGLKDILDTNAPSICTLGSLIGCGLTIWFMHKAAKESAVVQAKAEEEVQQIEEKATNDILTEEDAKTEKKQIQMNKMLKLLYIYRWAILSGFASGGLAVLSNKLNGRTIASMTAMLALNQDKMKKGAEKVKGMIGEEKFQQIQDDLNKEILGDRLTNGKAELEVSKKSAGQNYFDDDEYERYYDTFIGHIYEIPKSVMDDALSAATKETFLKWNAWRGMLGYESCMQGYKLGWGPQNRFKAHIGWIDIGNGGMKSIIYDTEPVPLGENSPMLQTFKKSKK